MDENPYRSPQVKESPSTARQPSRITPPNSMWILLVHVGMIGVAFLITLLLF